MYFEVKLLGNTVISSFSLQQSSPRQACCSLSTDTINRAKKHQRNKMGNSFHEFIRMYDAADSTEIAIPRTCLLSVAIVIQCVIGITTICKMRNNSVIGWQVTICFMLSFGSAVCCTVGRLALVLYDPPKAERDPIYLVIDIIYDVTILLFYWSRLLTFIVRLYVTFKTSEYRMSNKTIIMFTLIMILNPLVGYLAYVAGTIYGNVEFLVPIILCLLTSWFLLYIIGSGLAVHIFISNLSKLAMARLESTRQIPSPSNIRLSEQQQKLSNLSAKYTMLFMPAIISTILFVLLNSTLRYAFGTALFMILLPVDLCLNLWCSYLQFSFANHHYIRCCRRCDEYCRNYTLKRTRKLIYNHFISKSSHEITVEGDDESKPLDPTLSRERVTEPSMETGH